MLDKLRMKMRDEVTAMQKNNVKRFIRLASAPFGVFAEGDKLNFGRQLKVSLARAIMGAMVADERQNVRLTEQSYSDWRVVRAPFLTDQPAKGANRVGIWVLIRVAALLAPMWRIL